MTRKCNSKLEKNINFVLINARKKAGLSAKKASELIGISYLTYLKCEKGNYPNYKLQKKITDFYNLDIQDAFPKTDLIFFSQAKENKLFYDAWEEIEKKEFKEYLYYCINKLNKKKKIIIELHFGLNGKNPCTLYEIGNVFNLSGERIRQIEKEALLELRKKMNGKVL